MVVVLFDLEGTLVQSIEDDREAIREFRAKTKEKLVELGIRFNELEDLTTSTIMRNKAVDYIKQHFSKEEARRFHAELDRFLKSYELSWADHSRIFPETLLALNELKKHGYRMGVVTNTSREAAKRILSIHKLKSFFEVIVTREDVKKLKPDPEGILLALKRLDARDFFFVGDLVHDSMAAKKAGGSSIIVDRSHQKKGFQANYFVKSLRDILSLIEIC